MKTISISGTVAAGKTTLLNRLLDALGDRAAAHAEQPEENPFIGAYYADTKRWSFHSQVTFLSLYFSHPDWLRREREFFLYDRCLEENLVLAKYRNLAGDLTDTEYAVIERLGRGIAMLMPPIDRYIYLKCSPELLARRLRERGRDYEKGLGRDYIVRLKALYDAWAAGLPQERVLVVDEDEGVDLAAVMRFIGA